MRRRDFLQLCPGTTLVGLSGNAGAQAPAGAKEPRIGYQKNGVLVIARQQGSFEPKLVPRGIDVNWSEFTSGPPTLGAMNAGSVDIGQVGDTPSIFAQAAGAAMLYVAGQPITNGHGRLVKQDSPIRTLAHLKGRRVGCTQGSAALNVTLTALENANLTYADITPLYLSPHAALAEPTGRRRRVRPRQHRCLGDLGSVFPDRPGARRPRPGTRQ